MEIVNRNEVESFVTKDSSEIREILSPQNSSIKKQSLAEAVVKPGKTTREHIHPETEEMYYILEGEGTMHIEGERREVRNGDGIVILPGKKHKILNTGKINLIFLCCCVPAYTHEDTIIL